MNRYIGQAATACNRWVGTGAGMVFSRETCIYPPRLSILMIVRVCETDSQMLPEAGMGQTAPVAPGPSLQIVQWRGAVAL